MNGSRMMTAVLLICLAVASVLLFLVILLVLGLFYLWVMRKEAARS